MIRVSEHKILIENMLTDYNLQREYLKIVPNIQEWCLNNGIAEDNPNRIAKCVCREDGTRDILFPNEITDKMINSAKDSMFINGFLFVFTLLDTDLQFLIHTILHEIACPILQTTDQFTRDEWAFDQMKKYAI